ncbi:4-hydroxy-tetrahydrodipicolinate synthase [Anaerotalea alkaliphila]|uniref:4-hydroxy-tetrahydrodipicolinate synthase n=1 Tax=Anaerotalea alkaliphila TaxID=2662126 RepID=A0A7X5HTS7_9FIRM|nr:4-hydroxy-tetrahydrodipicolinate synthase [Anaerotalea alkaliphila]NDL66516.1 4-hydroxy-tetrahydrodipicolinate synthase [Anaerotalea alkaliphila]
MAIFTGSGVAIITPFNDDYSVNYEKLHELVDFNIENGTDSIVICGTTGEASTLDDQEHLACIRTAVEAAGKRVPVIAGTGSNDTAHGVHLSKEAEKLGVDGLLQVTPYYNKTSQKGLVEHFTEIARNVDIPILLYNVPSRTGMNLLPETCRILADVENIVGIKEASGNISQIMQFMDVTEGRLDLYSGNDDQIVPLLSAGGKGVISVVANFLPQETHDIVERYLSGDVKGSIQLQLHLLKLINALFCEVNPMPVKEAMNLLGYNVGPCRRPLTSMEPANVEKLKAVLSAYGLLK